MAVHGFRRTATGKVVLKADEVERGLLGTLVGQVLELVSPDDDPWGVDAHPLGRMVGIAPHAPRPEDPAHARGSLESALARLPVEVEWFGGQFVPGAVETDSTVVQLLSVAVAV